MVCQWFGLKTGGDGFLWFGLKIGGNGFLQFGLKTSGDGFLVEPQNHGGGGFPNLDLKTKQASVCRLHRKTDGRM
jgi:hypothetical protein